MLTQVDYFIEVRVRLADCPKAAKELTCPSGDVEPVFSLLKLRVVDDPSPIGTAMQRSRDEAWQEFKLFALLQPGLDELLLVLRLNGKHIDHGCYIIRLRNLHCFVISFLSWCHFLLLCRLLFDNGGGRCPPLKSFLGFLLQALDLLFNPVHFASNAAPSKAHNTEDMSTVMIRDARVG